MTHRIRNEIKKKKKKHVRCWHGTWLWICSRNSPCHLCETLQMQRPALTVLHCTRWQAILPTVTLAPGMAQHRNVTQVHTNTHTHAYMNTSIPSEPLWQINMPENHRDWFRTVFKVGQTRATVKFTVPPEARQQSILEINQNGKLVTCVSANLSVRHQNHTRGSL